MEKRSRNLVFKPEKVRLGQKELLVWETLIGPSGQGKTTTLNLLLGLYHPQKGRVYLGNPGRTAMEASSATRCLFSYIPQSNTLFTGTIADNMRMVKPEATDEEIRQALEAACAWVSV